MERSRQHIEELIAAYVSGEATTEERNRLERLYARAIQKKAYVDDLETGQIIVLKQEGFIKLLDEIHREPPKKLGLWSRAVHGSVVWKIAAAVTAITLGVWLYDVSSLNASRHSDAGQNPGLAINDIAPGKNTATLTLANGKVINLDTNRTSVIVTDSVKTATMLTASTPRGGTYQVTLPDGTKVWLNADSKISFPSQFSGSERKVLLVSGEAYFEVAKLTRPSLRENRSNRALRELNEINLNLQERIPFIVESRGQTVEVLGTHFNINSYADEETTKTTLLEGSVKINDHTILKPGEQASLKGDKLQVRKIDPALAIAWKNNTFMFDQTDLKSIMRAVARWYDVEVIYTEPIPNETYFGKISKYENVSELLRFLESAGAVQFRVEGRKIYVTKI